MLRQTEKIFNLIKLASFSGQHAVVQAKGLAEIGTNDTSDADAFGAFACGTESQIGATVRGFYLPG